MAGIPSLNGSPEEKIKAAVKWAESRLPDEALTVSSFLKLGKRKINEIIKSGKAPRSFSCLDKAGLIGFVLKENGFQTFLVSERIYHNGKSIGIHFSVQATDGKEKFTIDSHTLKTHVTKKWFDKTRTGSLTFSFKGNKNITYKRILRKEVPENAGTKTAFQLAGIRGRYHYYKRAKVNLLELAAFVKSRSRKSKRGKTKRGENYSARIARARKRANR